MNRRDVLYWMSGTVSLRLLGAGRFARAEEKRKTGLGIVIYALNLRRQVMKAQDRHQNLFDPFTFLDYCRDLGAGGIQVPLGVREEDDCRRLREKAEQYGMFIEGIAAPPRGAVDVERFEAEIRTASQAGALAVRTVILPGRRYEQFKSLDEFREAAEQGKQALLLAAPIAERHRVRLAVENHKDQRLDERLDLLRAISSEFVGACVDVGNSFALLEDPLAVVETYAPWAFSVHLKDHAVREYPEGFLLADVALGEGFLDLKTMVATLRRARPDVRFSLETITRDPLKVPCLSEAYWATMPNVAGSDLARTLRIVRANQVKQLPSLGELPLDQQAACEAAGIAKSLTYADEVLEL